MPPTHFRNYTAEVLIIIETGGEFIGTIMLPRKIRVTPTHFRKKPRFSSENYAAGPVFIRVIQMAQINTSSFSRANGTMVVVQINASIISILNIMSPIFEASNGLRTERPAAFSDNASFLSILPSPFYISPVDLAGSLFFFPGRFLRALFSFPPPSVFCTHPLVGSNEFSL